MSEEGGSWSKSQARRRRRQRNAAEGEVNSITEGGNKGEHDKTQATLITQSQPLSEKPTMAIDIKEKDKKEKMISDQISLNSLEKINKKSDKRKKHKTTKQNIVELKVDDSKIEQIELKLEKKQSVSEEKTINISKSTNSQLKTADLKEQSEGTTINYKEINKKKFKQNHENLQNSQKQSNASNEESSSEITENASKNEKEDKLKDDKSTKDQDTEMKGEESKNENSGRYESPIKSDCVHSISNPQVKEKVEESGQMQPGKENLLVQSGLGSDDLDPHYTSLCSSLTVQSETAGFFGVILETIEAAAGDQWIIGQFNKCQSDIDRIRALRNNDKVRKCLDTTLSHVKSLYREKSLKDARARRLAGDEALKRDDIRAALALYSQAVLRAPHPSDKDTNDNKDTDNGLELALAYGRRSEALLIASHFQLCLRDIKNALALAYPTDQKYLLVWRMGRCWRDWGYRSKARSAMLLADQLLQNAPPGFIVEMDQPRLQEEIISLEEFRDMSNHTEEEFNPEEGDRSLPDLSGGAQPKLADASAKLELRDNQADGRFLVTREAILPGDILVAQPALASSLLYEKQGTHCYRCFARLVAAEPCRQCAGVAFCSRRCARLADVWHRWECRHGELLRGSGLSPLARLALGIVARHKPTKLLPGRREEELETALRLCAHESQRDPRDHLQRCVMAQLLTAILDDAAYFRQQEDDSSGSLNELKENCSAVLARLLQVLQFNAHEVAETIRPADGSFRGSKVKYLGVAVYPTASLFNHDCHPALARYFVGTSIVLEAIRPLPGNGCPVPENYGPVYCKQNLGCRQRMLASRYWFRCRCQSCIEDWPLFEAMPAGDLVRFRCPANDKCQAKLLAITKKCLQCRRPVDFSEFSSLLKSSESFYQQALDEMDVGNVEEAHRLLCNFISIFYRLAFPPRREVQLAQIALASCAAAKGNTWFIKEDS